MALIAGDNPRTTAMPRPDLARLFGQRFALSWACLRRARDIGAASRLLQRVDLTITLQPVDHAHALLEAWIECEGVRQRSIHPPLTRPCAMSYAGGLFNVDMPGPDGGRLLALSVDIEAHRVAYAQLALLRHAGFTGGTYSPPALHNTGEQRVSQSA
jgi:hypothetical protein